MAFDGITIANIVKELNDCLIGGRIYKIAQPETDELLLTVKNNSTQYRLLLSADASLPLLYLTEKNKPSPMTAPGFCMLLRKHLQNARILSVTQPGLERIVQIHLEHLNELGDLCRKTLIIEIMGKHSNIIFCNDENLIIDSIKHISGMVSSIREVLPGKEYFIPQTQKKTDPFSLIDSCSQSGGQSLEECFQYQLSSFPAPIYKALYCVYTGLSPVMAQEICHRAQIDGDMPTSALSDTDYQKLYAVLTFLLQQIREGSFQPNIIYEKKTPIEFAAFPLSIYAGKDNTCFSSISEVLERYYEEKNTLTRIRQKSADLRKIVQTALERNIKKYDLQKRQIQDTEKRDKYRIYGELLNTYGYGIQPGAKTLEALNYYTDEMITIPLDATLTPSENAKKYFDKYGKLKRTYEALSELTLEVKAEIEHLESISAALDIALVEEDLVQIKEELIESGYIRRKGGGKKSKITSKPFHYLSSDGFHIYVGKNNYQNDELTFKVATGNDWWFHAKKKPGSHVIVKTEGKELPDRTFEEAARLAAYYSKGREQEKVEIDYLQKKNVKKPNGAKPGFVVYYTNYSMAIDSDISGLQQIP
ncbi:MAG: NFACT family protein [Blautia sp.]|nr:NFACT family protein [Lachnoclostridium sp.]MCM1210666.1 NFACT family protein [Blautia sp.]